MKKFVLVTSIGTDDPLFPLNLFWGVSHSVQCMSCLPTAYICAAPCHGTHNRACGAMSTVQICPSVCEHTCTGGLGPLHVA